MTPKLDSKRGTFCWRFTASVCRSSLAIVLFFQSWLSASAEQPREFPAESIFRMGIRYLKGDGVSKDPDKALLAFMESAKAGNPLGAYNAGLLSRRRGDLKDAMFWYEAAATNGVRNAVVPLGRGYVNMDQNRFKALGLAWLQYAASNNIAGGAVAYGQCLEMGVGGDQSYKKAAEWFRKAADAGEAAGETALGKLHRYARLGPPDRKRAEELFRSAAKKGEPEAQYELALLIEEQMGPMGSGGEMRQWLQRAAMQGFILAQGALGRALFKGQDGEVDEMGGLAWIFIAADNGENEARVLQIQAINQRSPDVLVRIRELANERVSEIRKLTDPVLKAPEIVEVGPPIPAPLEKSGEENDRPEPNDRLPDAEYMKGVYRAIDRAMTELRRSEGLASAVGSPLTGAGVVVATFYSNGRVGQVRIREGQEPLPIHPYLVQAVERAAPYRRWPQAMRQKIGRDQVELLITLDYRASQQ